MRAKYACLLRYKGQLVMPPGYLVHKGQPRPTSSAGDPSSNHNIINYSRQGRMLATLTSSYSLCGKIRTLDIASTL